MSAIDTLFQRLRAEGRKALMPFITAGDPDLDFTAELLRLLVAQGCSLCELGIPYSDPIADGPVIQTSYTRALAQNVTLAGILAMLRRLVPGAGTVHGDCPDFRPTNMGLSPLPPLVTMVSYSIVWRHGLEAFVAEAKAAGVAGAIVPDLPLEESAPLAELCRREDFSLIQLVAPTTPRDRALRIAERSTGFLYYVSVTGITGERRQLPPELVESVAWLREATPLPVCVGFGISRPEHVRMLAPVADGLIVGSAIVRRVAEAAVKPRQAVLDEIGQFVAELLAALTR